MSSHDQRMFRRVQHSTKLGVVTIPANDGGVVQSIQVKHNSLEDAREIDSIQFYGFASSPLPGCHVVTHQMSGDTSNGVAIGSNDKRYKPTGIGSGDVIQYDASGNQMWFHNGTLIAINAVQDMTVNAARDITVTAGRNMAFNATGGTITMTTPTVKMNANLLVTGDVTYASDSGDSYSIRELHEFDVNHTHPGVASGSAHTAVSDYVAPDEGA